jgi:chemotaxis protein MotA
MVIIIGFLIVGGCVIGGYLVAHGTLAVLLQPAELIIIAGAALGALIIGTPGYVIKKILSSIKVALAGKGKDSDIHMNILWVLYELSSLVRTEGILAMEEHVEKSADSKILQRIGHRKDLMEFLCDSLRLVLLGIGTDKLTEMLDSDLEVREEISQEPSAALATIADSLPGLGIVAAVLGIIITMNSIGGESALVGKHVAAALVGTFLGVLLAYGFVGPLSHVVKNVGQEELTLMKIARNGVLSLSVGTNPMMVCESARRAMPEFMRPSFKKMEDTLRQR